MILSRKDEIKSMFMKILHNSDVIELILFFEKESIDIISRNYWYHLFYHNRVRYVNYYEHLINTMKNQIIYMNGDIGKVNEENKIILNLKKQNQEWADAWMKSIRF